MTAVEETSFTVHHLNAAVIIPLTKQDLHKRLCRLRRRLTETSIDCRKIGQHTNFTYICTSQWQFIIFTSRHTNISGLRSRSEIGLALRTLRELLALPPSTILPGFRITNLTAVSQLPFKPNLTIAAALKETRHRREGRCVAGAVTAPSPSETPDEDILSYSYIPHKCPGARVRTRYGTSMVFSNGKITVLGANSENHVVKTILVTSRYLMRAHTHGN